MLKYLPHLIELRSRLIRCVIAYAVILISLFPFTQQIFHYISKYLLRMAPTKLIATGVTSTFMVPLKLILMVSIILIMPYILYQAWTFVAPGL